MRTEKDTFTQADIVMSRIVFSYYTERILQQLISIGINQDLCFLGDLGQRSELHHVAEKGQRWTAKTHTKLNNWKNNQLIGY